MDSFSVEGFIQSCTAAMSEAEDPQGAAAEMLRQVLTSHSAETVVRALDAVIPPGADIGEMVLHTSPLLTVLYGRVPPLFQSGIHNHTLFACIGQLVGAEENTVYERVLDGRGLRRAKQVTIRAGDVLELPADAIHSIQNPGPGTGSALHLYGGDFKAVMARRSLWTTEGHLEKPFSFEGLLEESVRAMQLDGNEAGLAELVRAIPAAKRLLDA